MDYGKITNTAQHFLQRGGVSCQIIFQRPQSYADILVKEADGVYVVWTDARADTFTQSFSGPDIYFARGSIICGINETESANKSEKIDFRISPNPFTKKTVIRYSSIVNSKNPRPTPYSLRIYDMSGRLVKGFTINECSLERDK